MAKLTTKLRITSKYKGNSKFPFFHNVQVGDTLKLTMPIAEVRRNDTSLYASYINWINETSKETFRASITESAKYLTRFEYTE